jgi:hypothetical protein
MRRLYRMTLKRPEMDSEGQIAPTRASLTSYPATGASYWPIIAQCTRVRVKSRYLEKFKINISTGRIHTKLSTRKRLNTKSVFRK